MEILALNPCQKNPRSKKKKAAHKETKKMARGRDSKGRFLPKGRSGGSKKGKRHYKRNPGNPPSTWKRRAKRAYHHGRGFVAGMGIGEALKTMAQGMIGAAAGMLVRKKFGTVGNFSDNWEMKDYFMAGLGGVGAALVAKMAFKASPATSRNIMVGGLALVGIKLLQDELIPKNATLQSWFGDDTFGDGAEGSWQGIGADEALMVGDIQMGDDGAAYVYGEDGQWRPADDSHRLNGIDELSGLVPPGKLGEENYYNGVGDEYSYGALVPPGNLGGLSMGEKFAAAYSRA